MSDIPLGLCQCGCGGKTNPASQGDTRHGYVKGQPMRFLRGHGTRAKSVPIHQRYEVRDNGCWEWIAGKDSLGYGNVLWNGKNIKAHRAVWEMHRGTIPDGLTLDHLCRNRACVNPDHLEPVTLRENILRGTSPGAINARKTHCKRGHEFTPENTKIGKTGSRFCIACRKLFEASRQAKAPTRR